MLARGDFTLGQHLLKDLVPLANAHQGLLYQMDPAAQQLNLIASWANSPEHGYPRQLAVGEGFIGQCAAEKKRIYVTAIPQDAVRVGPVMIDALPRSVIVLPIVLESQLKAVLALA